MSKFRTWPKPSRCRHDRTHYWRDDMRTNDKCVHCSDCHAEIARLTAKQYVAHDRSKSIDILNAQIMRAQRGAANVRKRPKRKVSRTVFA